MKSLIYILSFLATFTFGSSAVSAQQITDGSRPSITVEKGYSVSTVVSAVTSNTVQGNQLEAGNSIDVNIVSPSAPPSASGKIADFEVSPNSSLVELGGINHFSLVEYGEGSSLKTSVKTKENAILDNTISKASSSATIIIETELRAQQNALTFSESFDDAF
tara:strand:- start:2003 stop:2488 length:486 start_codon:yes stop_codon:yes gene_type:complete